MVCLLKVFPFQQGRGLSQRILVHLKCNSTRRNKRLLPCGHHSRGIKGLKTWASLLTTVPPVSMLLRSKKEWYLFQTLLQAIQSICKHSTEPKVYGRASSAFDVPDSRSSQPSSPTPAYTDSGAMEEGPLHQDIRNLPQVVLVCV